MVDEAVTGLRAALLEALRLADVAGNALVGALLAQALEALTPGDEGGTGH